MYKLLLISAIAFKGFSQCDIKTTYDKFTKVTTKKTNQSLKVSNKISTAYFSMTLNVGGSLIFNAYIHESFLDMEKDNFHISKKTILFTDVTTFVIGDEFEQLYLNTGVQNFNAILQKLKTKKVEAIRLYKDGTNYDFDLPLDQQDYFIKTIPCLFT